MNVLDVILIAVVVLGAIFGYKRGLVHTIYRFVSFALALILASRLYPIVADFLKDSFVYDSIRNRVGRSDDNMPAVLELFRVRAVEDYISGAVTNMAINIISLLIVFFLVLIVLYFAGKLLNIVNWIPVVRSFNRAGGFLVGVLLGAGVVWLCVLVISVFFITRNDALSELVQGSTLVNWMYENGWTFSRISAVE